jgi:hypothetical protein
MISEGNKIEKSRRKWKCRGNFRTSDWASQHPLLVEEEKFLWFSLWCCQHISLYCTMSNKELERIWKEDNSGLIRVLSDICLQRLQKKPQSKKPVSRLSFEPSTSRIQVYGLNVTPTSLVWGGVRRSRIEWWKELACLWRAVHCAKLLVTSFIWTFTTKFKDHMPCRYVNINSECLFHVTKPTIRHARIGFSIVKRTWRQIFSNCARQYVYKKWNLLIIERSHRLYALH